MRFNYQICIIKLTYKIKIIYFNYNIDVSINFKNKNI